MGVIFVEKENASLDRSQFEQIKGNQKRKE